MLELDQLRIGNRYSYDDFSASVRERMISAPAKKKIKETLPFSNVTYDFSSINGEIYWEERTLEYILEMDADSVEELESMKKAFKNWVMNMEKVNLYDPFILDHHFIATFDSISFDDSEIEKTTITLIFTAYPYMISNAVKRYLYDLTPQEQTISILNNSSHKITPTFISNVPATIKIGNMVYSMGAATVTDENIKLDIGVNTVQIKTSASSGTLRVEFAEEIF